MEPDNKKYLRLGAAVFAGLAAAILFCFFLLRFQEVKGYFALLQSALQPLITGILESDNDAAEAAIQVISSVEAFLAGWIKTELFSTVSVLSSGKEKIWW